MKCKAIKPDGTVCEANSLRSGIYCFRHSPENKEIGLLASSRGGQNRRLQGQYGTPQRLQSPADVKNFIGMVINSVWAGEIPVPVGTSLGFLARCWLDAHDAAETKGRLDEFEDKLSKMGL